VIQNGATPFYKRIDQKGLTFDQARAAAAAVTLNGLPGHPAIFETATYSQEFAFVRNNVYAPGVTNNQVYWVGASRPKSTDAGTLDWTWLDGTAVPTSITRSPSRRLAWGRRSSSFHFQRRR
jgi:hypothetical protein